MLKEENIVYVYYRDVLYYSVAALLHKNFVQSLRAVLRRVAPIVCHFQRDEKLHFDHRRKLKHFVHFAMMREGCVVCHPYN